MREFRLVPEDVYQVAIEDIVPVETEYQGKKMEKLRFQFVILGKGEYAGERLFRKAVPIVSNYNRPSVMWQIVQAATVSPMSPGVMRRDPALTWCRRTLRYPSSSIALYT